MLFWLAMFLSLVAFAAIGAGIALWVCSKSSWRPNYLRLRLKRWHEKIKKRNARRGAVEYRANEPSTENQNPSNEGDAA